MAVSSTNPSLSPLQPPPFLYRRLVEEIETKIMNGTYKVGDRLPSIRKLHHKFTLSISTVYRAYTELEAMGLIEARPKSGYYVSSAILNQLQPPAFRKKPSVPRKVTLTDMVPSIVAAMNDPNMLPFGSSSIASDLLPYKAIARILKSFTTQEIKTQMGYTLTEGVFELRRQLALRMLGWMDGVSAEEIVITNGCSEALTMALKATVKPGDAIAVESPTHFGLLQLLNELGVLIVEVPTDPQRGLLVRELEKVLTRHPIKACVVIPNFHNPLGALMPDSAKKDMVELLNQHSIPLIEDAIYAGLHYGPHRPLPLKTFDRKDLVITCSSFSKTLVPGFRIGWILPGQRFLKKVRSLKASINVSTATLNQNVLARYLAENSYERHLRTLRQKLKNQTLNAARAVSTYFPSQTRLAMPQGGALLWVQLPDGIDSNTLYLKAHSRGISILPGTACSMGNQFNNCIRIGCGFPFTENMEKGIETLGRLTKKMLYGKPK
jgi:DNA-binding transcriptional MocR family regulator